MEEEMLFEIKEAHEAINPTEPQPKYDGGPAFPKPYSTDEHKDQCNTGFEEQGMSLRDYFAGQALAGLLSDPHWPDAPHISQLAYEFADAMVTARDA